MNTKYNEQIFLINHINTLFNHDDLDDQCYSS